LKKGTDLLSDVVVYNKYSKYIPKLKRRETWSELVDRYIGMMLKKYPKLSKEIITNGQFLRDKKVLPSMRAAQFSGNAIIKNEARIYNCSYMPISDYRAFSELMFLLLGGTGCGYSVQYHHIEQLPEIHKPTKEAKFLIGDSIEGWADAVKQLMKSYFGIVKVKPRFDYSDIREKGARLVTAGGKAPGPEPLRICLTQIQSLLNEKENGSKLTSVEVHDICCYIANAVLAGGIRRAALISLFSFDDKEMATCKHGNWWELNPQRGRANNSAVILRNRVKKNEFDDLFALTKASNSGEPGIYFTNDPEYGTNPCCEISLRPYTFCNLTELNAGLITTQEEFNKFSEVAAFFGTLQAGFTDFHYLRPIWRKNSEKDALVGVGITGICNGTILELNLTEAAKIALEENDRVADLIGINSAARLTTIKPSGSTSCVVGTSSGIHAWHSKYYIRNMQCKVGDDIYNYFNKNHPELIKIMDYDVNSAVIGLPCEAPNGSILREKENALDMLERVKKFNIEWVREGHRRGPNTNNVSATVSIDGDKEYITEKLGTLSEWDVVGTWMWDEKNIYNGLSVLPFDGGTYADAPFQSCTKEEFEAKSKYIADNPIDLSKIIEEDDNTDLAGEIACAGGACEIL
jgi:ribonucleoside-diphosphate reductase alpha chain